jgi:myo-inositol-1(or 4)-monophosphatase
MIIREVLDEICELIIQHMPQIEATRYKITLKEDGTPVTSSDLYVENLVHNFVKEKFPRVVFIAEESFNYRNFHTEDYIVVLDPIDGTENFCSGLKEWGISFGIWMGNSFQGAFLLMPELGLKLMTGDKLEKISSRLTGVSSSISQSILDLIGEPGEYRITGCAVYNLYNVIRGSFQKFVNPKGAHVWDLLPGMMLALEHGCTVYVEGEPYSGQFLNPTKKYRIEVSR